MNEIGLIAGEMYYWAFCEFPRNYHVKRVRLVEYSKLFKNNEIEKYPKKIPDYQKYSKSMEKISEIQENVAAKKTHNR